LVGGEFAGLWGLTGMFIGIFVIVISCVFVWMGLVNVFIRMGLFVT